MLGACVTRSECQLARELVEMGRNGVRLRRQFRTGRNQMKSLRVESCGRQHGVLCTG